MMSDSAEQMKLAAFLARSGEPDRARSVFARLVEDDPANFQAWLWLSELSYNLEEQTALLEQAMKYLPAEANGRKDLQAHLNDLRSSIPLPAASSGADGRLAAPTASSGIGGTSFRRRLAAPAAPEISFQDEADLRCSASPVDVPQIGEPEVASPQIGGDDDSAVQQRLVLFEAPSYPVAAPEKQRQGRPILDLARSLFTRLF